MAARTTKKRGTFVGEVTANEVLCDEHYLLRLAIGEFPPTLPGQFVQLQCRGLDEQIGLGEVDWPEGKPPRFTQAELTGYEPLLRRPFSLAGRGGTEDGDVELDIIYRAIGRGTKWLAGVKAGDRLSVLGPLGNAFAILDDKPMAALVGGGVGIPPMLYLAEALAAAGKRTVAFSGVRSANLLPLKLLAGAEVSAAGAPTHCVAEFEACNASAAVATDDGSIGFKGMVSDAFANWLDAHVQDPAKLAVYCCGPEEMMQAVAELCIRRGVECQLAMERHMACGMGTCQSCIVKVRSGGESGWCYKLCCTDGPIFDAREIIWI